MSQFWNEDIFRLFVDNRFEERRRIGMYVSRQITQKCGRIAAENSAFFPKSDKYNKLAIFVV